MAAGIIIDGLHVHQDALKGHPDHAAALGRICTTWSLIEGTIGGILGILMRADPMAAVALLERFSNNRSRVEAVRKVAEATLTGDDAEKFDELMERVLKYAEKRNAIAHGLWGVVPQDKENIYRLPVKSYANFATLIAHQIDPLAQADKLSAERKPYSLAALQELEGEGAALMEAIMADFTRRVKERSDAEPVDVSAAMAVGRS